MSELRKCRLNFERQKLTGTHWCYLINNEINYSCVYKRSKRPGWCAVGPTLTLVYHQNWNWCRITNRIQCPCTDCECVWCKLKQILNWLFINLLVHLNSCVARLWMALFFRWTGFTHRGPELVRPRLRSQSANQAMWQLQLKGFEIRLRLVIEVNSSKAPGVTQLMRLP